jgi:hypothetical protein
VRNILNHNLQELRVPNKILDGISLGAGITAALALLDNLVETQNRVIEEIKADAENSQAIELSAGEIFSSDVDFF